MAPRVCLSSMSTTSWLARVRPAGGRIHPLLLALHILPEGFHRIRYYGFLGNRHRKEKLEQCRHALGTVSLEEAVSSERAEQDLSRPLRGSYRFFPVGMPRLPPRAHDRNPGDRSLRLFRINRHLLRTGLVFNSDLYKLAFAKSAEKYFLRGLRASFTSSFCLTRRLSKSSSYHPGDSAIVTLSAFCFFPSSERPFNTYRPITAQRLTPIHF